MTEENSNPDQAALLASELRLVVGRVKRRLREETQAGDVSWSQMSILSLLDREGPATVTTLARVEGMRPQSMGATIAILQAAGLLVGTPDPTDGRQTLLSLTSLARKLIEAGRAARQDWLSRVIATKLTAPEQETLADAIGLLKRLAAP